MLGKETISEIQMEACTGYRGGGNLTSSKMHVLENILNIELLGFGNELDLG